ncbi:NUDIX domain-containing protein [Roseibium sediminicola]|uniref:NUDIX domain-containing protein n=1 Tax=Roseibium sediminicola TaxID=2933272 RepID=A0ABT0H253_9HYPH|nr:NUDIX domain-containing protein [Roseibium sp. CAU 1639]MCK7615768.1 NUDIX domain-containing protein [Roseibium sp. CAU 1639]
MLKLLSLLPASWTRRLIQQAGLVRNPYTLGVRVIVEDGDKRVLLVRHSYLAGWYLPGGGVDRGETMPEAACREVQEEAGIAAEDPPRLLNVYLNAEVTGRDHVGLFHLERWSKTETFLKPNAEILEAGFFAVDALPDGLSKATALRLEEFRSGVFVSDRW